MNWNNDVRMLQSGPFCNIIPYELTNYILSHALVYDPSDLSICLCCKLFKTIVYDLWKQHLPFLEMCKEFIFFPKGDYDAIMDIFDSVIPEKPV